MRKKLILLAVAFIATIGIASAQNTQEGTTSTRKACCVDANSNGVCDKKENGTCKVGNGKGGNGNNGGKQAGKGKCCKSTAQGLRDGSGQRNGGCGTNFADVNNNGVCDRRETSSTK